MGCPVQAPLHPGQQTLPPPSCRWTLPSWPPHPPIDPDAPYKLVPPSPSRDRCPQLWEGLGAPATWALPALLQEGARGTWEPGRLHPPQLWGGGGSPTPGFSCPLFSPVAGGGRRADAVTPVPPPIQGPAPPEPGAPQTHRVPPPLYITRPPPPPPPGSVSGFIFFLLFQGVFSDQKMPFFFNAPRPVPPPPRAGAPSRRGAPEALIRCSFFFQVLD